MPSLSMEGIGITTLLKRYYPHDHPEWEFAFYIEGTGNITVNDRIIPFCPGTLVCVPPNTIHSEESEHGYRNYHFGVRDFSLGDNDIVFHDNDTNDLRTLLDMMFRSTYSLTEKNTALANSLLDAFLNTMLANSNTVNKHVERMVQSIVTNISNPHYKISEAYKDIPMSTDHLRRLFIANTGMTPTRYLLDKRIRQAQKLLMASNHPSIKQVSMLCGFADQYYFSRAFKKHTGMSPIKYSSLPAG